MESLLMHIGKSLQINNSHINDIEINIEQMAQRHRQLTQLIKNFADELKAHCDCFSTERALVLLCPYEFIGRSQGGAIRTNNVISVILRDCPVVSISYTWTYSRDYTITRLTDNWLHVDVYHKGAFGGWTKAADFHYVNWYTPEMLQIVREVSSTFKIRHLWLEYSFMSTYKHIGLEYNVPVSINFHNIEWQLAKELSKDEAFSYLEPFGHWEACKIIEEESIRQSINIIVTTERDAKYCRNLQCEELNLGEVYVAPNVISFDPIIIPALPSRDRLNFIFVGDCRYAPNLEGLKWFIDLLSSVEKSILQDFGFHLTIIGKGSEIIKQPDDLKEFLSILGFVDDLRNHYLDSDVSLIPLITGGGSRLKAYEAVSFGKIILATEKGIEGIDFASLSDYIFTFSDAKELVERLDKIRNCKLCIDRDVIIDKYTAWYAKEQKNFVETISGVLT